MDLWQGSVVAAGMSIGQNRGFTPTWSLGLGKEAHKTQSQMGLNMPRLSGNTQELPQGKGAFSPLALEMNLRALWGSLRVYNTFSAAGVSKAQSDLPLGKRGEFYNWACCVREGNCHGKRHHPTLQDLPLIGVDCSLQMETVHDLCHMQTSLLTPKNSPPPSRDANLVSAKH